MEGILAQLENSDTTASVIGNAAVESELFLDLLASACESDQEFAALMESAGVELALYGLIENAEVAEEVVKRIQVTDWKQANFNRIAKRTAIRLAMINNDMLYTKYKKYRNLLIEYREKIYKKYGQKAKVEARKIIKNARNKAANMNSADGKNITEKMDKVIASVDEKK